MTEATVEMTTDQSTTLEDMSLPIEEAPAQTSSSWADITAQDEEDEQKNRDEENEGILTGDQVKAWSRVLGMTDEDLRRNPDTVNRSGLNTYHFDPSLVNTTSQETAFDRPADLPAWVVRDEFLHKLNACKFLIVKAPTGSGKSTIFPALAAKVMPKERVMCTQVKRNTTEAVCQSTKRCGNDQTKTWLSVSNMEWPPRRCQQMIRQGFSSVQKESPGMRFFH